jgi:hypothetical protein
MQISGGRGCEELRFDMASKTNTVSSLDRARADLAAVEGDLAAMQAKRQARLLAGDTASAISKIDLELEALQQAARTERDRILALTEQQKAEEAAAAEQAKAEHIEKTEQIFERRNEKADKLEKLFAEARDVLRSMAADNAEIDAAWRFEYHDRTPLILPTEHLIEAVRFHLFRLSTPPVTGKAGAAGTACDLPGGKNPKPLTWSGQPEKAPSISSAMREAARLGSEIMRTGKSTSGQVSASGALIDGVPAFMLREPPPLSPDQQRLQQLLRQQAELALDVSEAGEAKYQQVIEEMKALEDKMARRAA